MWDLRKGIKMPVTIKDRFSRRERWVRNTARFAGNCLFGSVYWISEKLGKWYMINVRISSLAWSLIDFGRYATPEEYEEQNRIANEIIDEILEEEREKNLKEGM